MLARSRRHSTLRLSISQTREPNASFRQQQTDERVFKPPDRHLPRPANDRGRIKWGASFMTKIAILSALIAMAFVAVPAAYAQDNMKKDGMSNATMSKDNMAKD